MSGYFSSLFTHKTGDFTETDFLFFAIRSIDGSVSWSQNKINTGRHKNQTRTIMFVSFSCFVFADTLFFLDRIFRSRFSGHTLVIFLSIINFLSFFRRLVVWAVWRSRDLWDENLVAKKKLKKLLSFLVNWLDFAAQLVRVSLFFEYFECSRPDGRQCGTWDDHQCASSR